MGSPTDFERLRGNHPLAVYLDLKSSYAYLAVEPTRAMAAKLGVPIDWRPFTLDIPSYLGSAKLDKGGKKVEKSARSPNQWSGVKVAQSLASDLEARGLSGAPLYQVAGQVFMGRQHLPMIE